MLSPESPSCEIQPEGSFSRVVASLAEDSMLASPLFFKSVLILVVRESP